MKRLKLILLVLLVAIVGVFFLLPLAQSDSEYVAYSVDINYYPEAVYIDLLNAQGVDQWLRNNETPETYTIMDGKKEDTTFSFTRIGSDGIKQAIILDRVRHSKDGIVNLVYDIAIEGAAHAYYLSVTLIPDGHIIVSGGSANTTELSLTYGINYGDANFLQKTWLKWKFFFGGTTRLDEEVNTIGAAVKQTVEDNRGRLLQ